MGYLCPVCKEPFGDEQACANHLAVTAILHGGPHDDWLAESVDDWETIPRSELAEHVAELAEETTDHDHPGEHNHTHPVGEQGQRDRRQSTGQPALTASDDQLDADAKAILSEARELTRKMQQRGPDAESKRKES